MRNIAIMLDDTTKTKSGAAPSPRARLIPLALSSLLLVLAACSKQAPQAPAAGEGAKPDAAAAKGEAQPGSAGDEAGHEEDEGSHEDAQEAAGAVKIDAAAMRAAGIRIEALAPGALGGQLRAPGEVLDNAYGTTLITPRVAALVVRRHAKLGDEVRNGAPLVTLASVEVSDAQAELRIAEQEWRRVSSLGTEAVSGRRIGEARIAVDRARAKAQAYGLPGTSSGSVSGQFVLNAPHAGRITEDDFVVGERIEPGRALYRLVDESTVWVDARLPPGKVPDLAPGSEATVVAGGERLQGKVLRTSHRTSESTRNAVVRIEVPNRNDRLHGGDFVDVYLDAGDAARRLSVPTTALVQMQGDTVVFRQDKAGALEAVPVRTGAVIGDVTAIEEGLEPGDRVVVAGAFAVKASMLKSQLGEGHGH
ncbi:efflux RND transporter periplasmic adaptor subunit [Luteimonas aquatica]|uniref:efflux RND transporter periplasmic adaptor subunit n=1 Tax=Luteimonas aquatica TaxID=450364 RepID=UPI001F57CA07|nr:efflux RND transporter periplasmic adaptor subunit [Luteimonas aquatica]